MRNIVAELRALADREGLGLPDEAADELDRMHARVAELEAARGEPLFWKIDYPHDMPTQVLLSAPVVFSDKNHAKQVLNRLQVSYEGSASIVPLFLWDKHEIDINPSELRAALRAIFNAKG